MYKETWRCRMVSLPAPGPAPAWLKSQLWCIHKTHLPQAHLVTFMVGTPCHFHGVWWQAHLVTPMADTPCHINGVSWQHVTVAHAPRDTLWWCECAIRGTLQWCVLGNVQCILLGNVQGYFQECHPSPIFWGVGDVCLVYLPNISINIATYRKNI